MTFTQNGIPNANVGKKTFENPKAYAGVMSS